MLESAKIAYTPSIVLAEISRKYSEKGYSKEEIRGRIESVLVLTRILYVDESLSLYIPKAYKVLSKKKGSAPGTLEVILLSSAWKVEGKLVTGNPIFKDLSDVIWIWERSFRRSMLISCSNS